MKRNNTIGTTLEEERLAIEMFEYVMKGVPWDHNVVILQEIYRTLAKKLIKNYTLKKK